MATKGTWEGGLRNDQKTKKKDKQNIAVFVRCRPFSEDEKKQGVAKVVSCNPYDVELKERATGSTGQHLTKKFTFDRVFSPAADQIEVYQEVVAPVVKEALQGYNCTVFAYGQTGTGKTFTMEGVRSDDTSLTWDADPLSGIIPRCIHQIFDTLESNGTEFGVRVSYLELYNEELFDLLSNSDSLENGMKLKLLEGNDKQLNIQNLSEHAVRTKFEVYKILAKGTAKRKTAETLMNAHSSRSHSIFMVTIHMKEYNVNGEEELIKTAKLNLVDLAGSENVGRSGAKGARADEAGNINRSLLTLGRVITSLVDRTPHIPYRESKLTRLLQDSLGGRTKTTIIATISPGVNNMEETLSTLDYAHRAKNITNKPEVNQKMSKKALIKQYEDEIEQLKRDLYATREKNGFFIDQDNYEKMKNQIEMNAEIVKQLEETIEAKEQSKAQYEALFISTSSKLEKTTDKLQETRVALREVHTKLCSEREERDAKAAIVKELEDTEARLAQDLQRMISVADEEKENLNAVHDKLDRQRKVDEKNQAILSNHVDSFSSNVAGIRELCSSHTSLLTSSSMQHLNSVKETTNRSVADIENSKSMLTSLSAQLRSCLSRHGKDENNVIMALNDVAASTEDSFKTLESFVNSFMTKHFLTAIDEVTARLAEQQTQLQTLLSTAVSDHESLLARSTAFESSHSERLAAIEADMTKEYEEEARRRADSDAIIKTQLEAALSQLLSGRAADEAASETATQRLTQRLGQAKDHAVSNSQHNRTEAVASHERLTSIHAATEASRAAGTQAITQLPASVETLKVEYASKTKRRVKDVGKEIHSTIDVIDDVNTQAEEKLASHCAALDSQVSERQQWAATFEESVQSDTEQGKENMQAVEVQLNSLVTKENTLVNEDIAKNNPTGQTPKRKTFKYPGSDSILRSRDYNTIREEFQENYNLNDSIVNAYDPDLNDSLTSDSAASCATADSGRPGSRAASRDRGAKGGIKI